MKIDTIIRILSSYDLNGKPTVPNFDFLLDEEGSGGPGWALLIALAQRKLLLAKRGFLKVTLLPEDFEVTEDGRRLCALLTELHDSEDRFTTNTQKSMCMSA